MSDIYHEFECQLASWEARYAGRPDHEMVRLSLLALEREENVAVAYHEDVIGRRLADMRLPDGVRTLMRNTLGGVWKDEQMHVIYVRRALLSLGNPLLSARTFLQQIAGSLGGWTVSVRQHRRWSQAPLSRAAATVLMRAGEVTGRVPLTVRRRLVYSSFRDFCRYNVETEGTAWLCWQRLTALAANAPALSGRGVDDFRRITDDEDRHRQVFQILADALTDGDRLRAGGTVESLSAQIGAVGAYFLVRPTVESPQSAATGILGQGAFQAWTARTSTRPQRIDRSRSA